MTRRRTLADRLGLHSMLARCTLTALFAIAYAGHFYQGALITGVAAFYAWTAR